MKIFGRAWVMIRHYGRSCTRNVLRQRWYAAINITGLLISLWACITLLLFVQQELSVDEYHEFSDRIYRVITDTKLPTAEWRNASTEGALAPAIVSELAEVEEAVRMWYAAPKRVRSGQHVVEDQAIVYAESSLFRMFTFTTEKDGVAQELDRPNAVLITQSLAQSLFGKEDAVGQTVHFTSPKHMGEQELEYEVAGVLDDIPGSSHLTMDMVVSFATLMSTGLDTGWRSFQYWTYVLLDKGANVRDVERRINSLVEQRRDMPIPDMKQVYHLQPLTDIYFGVEGAPRQGDVRLIRIYAVIALLILVITCSNYSNLTAARAVNRGREVGVRKAVGASRLQLMCQFLFEAMLLAVVTLPFALLVVRFTLPGISQVIGREIMFDLTSNFRIWIWLAALMLMFCALAGGYPAWILSRFRPAVALRGNNGMYSTKAVLQGSLIIVQFTVAVALISCTLAVSDHLEYIRNKDLGFVSNNVLTIKLVEDDLIRRFDTIRDELGKTNGVMATTASGGVPGDESFEAYRSDVMRLSSPDRILHNTIIAGVDHYFLDAFGIDLLAGSGFRQGNGGDQSQSFILNLTAVRKLGWDFPEQAVGERLRAGRRDGTVIGIMKDFHTASLRDEIEPVLVYINPEAMNTISLRLREGNSTPIVNEIRERWNAVTHQQTLHSGFLDHKIEALYGSERRIGLLIAYFAALALVCACLGLFGLTGVMVEQRTKEIAIRRILGAGAGNIIGDLAYHFGRLIAAAILIGVPLAYIAYVQWQDGFAYRSSISMWLFVFSSAIVVTFATGAAMWQVWRALRINPAYHLRTE